MDDFIDNLMREDHYCDIQLPRLQVSLKNLKNIFFLFKQKRQALEETDQLEVYQSALDEDLERLSSSDDSEDERDRRRRSRPSVSSFLNLLKNINFLNFLCPSPFLIESRITFFSCQFFLRGRK